MQKIVRSAVVGLGAIGPTHVQAVRNIENAKLVAVCDIVAEKAKAMAEANDCKAYFDFDTMLRDPDIDLVHICLPSGMHAEFGVRAARAGKNVLVEKPIDVTLEAADRLIAVCEEAGVVLSCISQHRFDDAMIEAHKALEQGLFGKLTFGGSHTKWYRSQGYYDSGDWRGTYALDGGGALMNQSVHYVDMLQYMMGDVDEVFAYCATLAHERIEVEDVAAATIKFKSGALIAYVRFNNQVPFSVNLTHKDAPQSLKFRVLYLPYFSPSSSIIASTPGITENMTAEEAINPPPLPTPGWGKARDTITPAHRTPPASTWNGPWQNSRTAPTRWLSPPVWRPSRP
jgi:predicted dehydrogenase